MLWLLRKTLLLFLYVTAFALPCYAAYIGTNLNVTGPTTVAEAHGTIYTVTLTSNSYTTTITDCGKTLLLPTGTTPTVKLGNVNPTTGECSIKFVQTTAGASLYTFSADTGGTMNTDAGDGLTHSKAQYAIVGATLMTPSASAAVWILSGTRS